jgi:hypothetical protein
VSGNVCNLRLSDASGGRMVSTVGVLGERDIGLVERENEPWNMKIGCERTRRLEDERIDKRGVEGQPWSWFQQSPQTRESIIRELGDSNRVKGTLRGGWRK